MDVYAAQALNGWLLLVGLLGVVAQADVVVCADFERDHQAICRLGSRFAGQPGAEATADYIERELTEAGITQRWRQPVEIVLPVTKSCTLQINNESAIDLHPVWPNGANLSTTPSEGITARAVYVGTGELETLPVAALTDAIAVMEFNSGTRWKYAAMYGARAIVFLPPDATTWTEANDKYTYVSLPLPRFYVADRNVADRLRSTKNDLTLTIHSQVHWERRIVHNVLGFIPGSHAEHRKRVAIVHSRYDASGVVPDQAFGAEQAINPAAVLQIARRLAAKPPAYSVLVAFVAGDTFELTGSRRLMKTLTGTQRDLIQSASNEEAELATLRGYRQRLTQDNLIETTRGWDNRRLRTEHLVWRAKMKLVRLLDEIEQRRERKENVTELNAQRVGLLRVQRHLLHDDVGDEDTALLQELLPDVQDRLHRMIAERVARLEKTRVELEIMRASGLGRGARGDYGSGMIFFSLELSSHGRQFGPFAQSYMCELLLQNQLMPYGEAMRQIANGLDVSAEIRASFLDDATDSRRHWQSDVPFPVINGVDAAVNGGCLGIMFATTQDMRRWIDTPMDTIDHVDFDQLLPQVVMAGGLLDRMLRLPVPIIGSRRPRLFWKWEGIAAVPTPGESQLDLGVPDVVIFAKNYWADRGHGVRGIGVRDMCVLKTDSEGRFAIDDIMDEKLRASGLRAEVFLFDDDGKVIMSMDDFGPWNKPNNGHDRKKDFLNQRGEMFKCAQIGIVGLYDPHFLENLDRVILVDAARGAETRSKSTFVDNGFCNVCVPRNVDRWQIVFAKGDSSRRMLLLNSSPSEPEGTGFPLDWRQRRPVAFTSASDFAYLNEHRIDRLENTGVIDPYLRGQHTDSQAEAGRADQARKADDGTGAWRHANRALTTQAQVYQKTRRAADDTVYAVLFLLVGLVPFCYFVERLVFGATHVYRQIGGFVLLFVSMTVVVGLFHPAFRVSLTPITILLAFIILLLSVVVIVIVLGKFSREIQALRNQKDRGDETGVVQSASASSDFKRLDVLHRAMTIGISNMRRRKMRTGLTLTTLVLLSFVIMSFTSPQTHLHPLHYELTEIETDTDRQAVMIHRMSWGALPDWALDHMRTTYRDQADIVGHWWITRNNTRSQFSRPFTITGRDGKFASLPAIMCIDPDEARAVGLDRLAGTSGIDALGSRPDSILIADSLAKRIGVNAGDKVTLFDSQYTVAAVMDHKKMLALTGLDGQRWAPVDFMSLARRKPEEVVLDEANESAADITRAARSRPFRPLSPEEFVVIPASRANELDASLRAVVLLPHDPNDTMALADTLAGDIRKPIYANTSNRIVLCAAVELTRLTGMGSIVIPLIISAMIILNTMLNCVYERRREIAILMSVGLAPAHVGALFVAEAAAYGTIGIVGGYIIGQALGTVASTYDLIPGLRLNFSSSAAIYTQVAIMAVVLLSSIWPAMVARRIAAPGSEATWKLPPPNGDVIEVALPFTLNARDSSAVLTYLHEWMAGHTESSVGRFTSGAIEVFVENQTRGMVAQIWLAPFDLGIMQTVQLDIQPGKDPHIDEVKIALRREAGPYSAWVRGNRNFLTDLRKQFLLWRSLGHAQMDNYRRSADDLFQVAENG